MSIAHHEISHDYAKKIMLLGSGKLKKEFVNPAFAS